MNTEKIIDKVRKTFNLANNAGATEAERETAMRMAYSMMAKYNLIESDLDLADDPRQVVDFLNRGAPWIRHVSGAISRMFFCKFYYTPGSSMYKYSFVGKTSNSVTAQLMAEYVIKSIKKEASKMKREAGQNGTWELNFCKGAAIVIVERCNELRLVQEKETTTTSTGTNLTLASVYESEKVANDSYLAGLSIKLKTGANSGYSIGAGYGAGQDFGSNVSLHNQVGGRTALRIGK